MGIQGGETQRAVEAAAGGNGLGDYDFSLEHDGIERTYKVHVPPSYNKYSPTPVIINLHGGGGNADRQIDMSKMNDTSDKEGFIVIYPDGTGQKLFGNLLATWNAEFVDSHCHDYPRNDHYVDFGDGDA